MGKRNRVRKKARGPATLDVKRRILCICEGERTEPDYINAFAAWQRNPLVSVEPVGGQGVPLSLVQEAKRRKKEADKTAKRAKDSFLKYDEIWCVGDVDEHPHLKNAHEEARLAGILLATSNEAIELWLLLHFQGNPGAQGRVKLMEMLKKHLPSYDKKVDFERFKEGYFAAVERAKRLDDDAEKMGEAGRNPTTGFWRLTESIRAK